MIERLEEDTLKVISTTQVNVYSDKPKDILKSLSRAESIARIRIVNLFKSGDSANSDKINNTQNISKSIIKLGSCYEPNKFVRVTLGKKIDINNQ